MLHTNKFAFLGLHLIIYSFNLFFLEYTLGLFKLVNMQIDFVENPAKV